MNMEMDMDMSENSQQQSPGQERKGPWSPEEDTRLKKAVESCSPRPKWAEIANSVEGRSAKQCRERWEQNLSPRLNKNPISSREADFIIQFVNEQGKKWAEIARQLHNRSDNNIKNWYNGMVQKGKTGRGPQDDPLRAHFSPEHQNFINQLGRRSTHNPHQSPQMVHQQPVHYNGAPYPHQAAWATPAQSPYCHPSVNAYGQPVMHNGAYQTSAPAYHHQHHQQQQAPQPTPAIHLPPLPPLQTTPGDYFQKHPSFGTPSVSPDMRHYRQSSDALPLTNPREGSHDAPGLSGSTSSTPLQGSPLTPVSQHSDIYRRHDNSDVEHDSLKPISAKTAQPNRLSVASMLN